MKKSYKTIFFDWNKTLSYSLFWEQWSDKNHPNHNKKDILTKELFVNNKDIIKKWMLGDVVSEDIAGLLNESVGLTKEDIISDLAHSCENMSYAFEDLLNTIQNIRKRGVKCVIATDNMDTFRRWTIPGMKLEEYFDDFLISNELKIMKFDIDEKNGVIPFFDLYLRENNLNYSDVVLVDDCIDDGFYAKKGFDILQIDSPDSLKKVLASIYVDHKN